MNRNKRNQGITLIALAITIIVLLILAGISITALTGNNGIITQAIQAKESNNIAEIKERIEVEVLKCIDKKGNFKKGTFKANVEKNLKGSSVIEKENKIIVNTDGYRIKIDGITGNIIGEPSKITMVKPGIIVAKTEEDNYSDGEDTATIPEGFTVDETENTISKGLVVHGPDKADGDSGSEFVWIPVPDINVMSQCSTAGGDCDLQLDGNALRCVTHDSTEIVGKIYAVKNDENFGEINTTYTDKRKPGYLDISDNQSYNTIGLTLSAMQTDYKNMAVSVAKYGGFYVGRYETSLSDATSKSEGVRGTVQSKVGRIPTSAGANSGTRTWYGLYSKQDKTYTGTNNSVESSMIWGSQYDRILNWAKEGVDKEKITNTSLGNNSNGKITTTGNSEYLEDSINNIRDLGGNLFEWTLEATGQTGRIFRGGNFYHNFSPSYRLWNTPANNPGDYGSRLALYIK